MPSSSTLKKKRVLNGALAKSALPNTVDTFTIPNATLKTPLVLVEKLN
jgi:hypothetical protein